MPITPRDLIPRISTRWATACISLRSRTSSLGDIPIPTSPSGETSSLPRPQSAQENCTIHYYNVVPLQDRYVVVSGNYQAGTWVTDFTDPENPLTIAWSDPPPLDLLTVQDGDHVDGVGGAWSSYWYNNFIYESEITKGLHVFRLSDGMSAAAIRLHHLNPQTQEFSIFSR